MSKQKEDTKKQPTPNSNIKSMVLNLSLNTNKKNPNQNLINNISNDAQNSKPILKK